MNIEVNEATLKILMRLNDERRVIISNMSTSVEAGAHDAVRHWIEQLETINANMGVVIAAALENSIGQPEDE